MKPRYFVTLAAIALALVAPGLVGAGGAPESTAKKEPIELVVLSHAVHQDAMKGRADAGKDLLKEFLDTHPNVKNVKFITAGTPEVGDRLFREASLPKTDIDVAFAYSPWLAPKITNFFVPLDELMAANPLQDKADLIPSFFEPLTIGGKTYGVPMRTGGGSFLFYNKKILAERGVKPPKTLEELVAAVKATSFTRANGERVYGFVEQGTKAEITFLIGCFARAMDADMISKDYKSNLTSPAMIQTLRIFRDLTASGCLPDNFTAMSNADGVTLFQNNRVAFQKKGPDYMFRLSKPGTLEVSDLGYMNFPPLEKDLNKWGGAAPTETFQWAMVIPKGSQHKQEAWEFIRFMSTKDAVLNEALTGNNPTRASTFQDQQYKARTPYLDGQLTMFKLGRPMYPAFDNYTQVNDIIGEYMQAVVLGRMTPEQAMGEAEAKIKPLLP